VDDQFVPQGIRMTHNNTLADVAGLHDETVTPTLDRLWTQREAAAYLGVTGRFLRDSTCPKMLLPGNGEKGQPIVRYAPAEVRAWARSWHSAYAGISNRNGERRAG
jgi:hypothetical protein